MAPDEIEVIDLTRNLWRQHNLYVFVFLFVLCVSATIILLETRGTISILPNEMLSYNGRSSAKPVLDPVRTVEEAPFWTS